MAASFIKVPSGTLSGLINPDHVSAVKVLSTGTAGPTIEVHLISGQTLQFSGSAANNILADLGRFVIPGT